MIARQYTQQQLVAMLAWQVEMGADEVVLDQPACNPDNLRSPAHVYGTAPVLLSPAQPLSSGGLLPSVPAISASLVSPTPAPVDSTAKVSVNLNYIKNLPDLAIALDQLDNCPLKHTASTMCFSDGNAGARLMVIGEAPGRDEDRVGVPFVGAAGQFLDDMLASINLDRGGVYLANFLPWRPPGNRTATAEEINMLLPYIHRHIQLANPEMVVILGGTPAKAMLECSDDILKLRGRWQKIDYGDGVTRLTMASLHPAYLMRSPAQKRLAFDDWCKIYRQLGSMTRPPVV